MNILYETKIEDITPSSPGGVICADKNDSIPDVLNTMSENNILAMPVIDKHNKNQLVGFVDMLDMITFVVRFIEESQALTDRRNFDQYMQQCQASFDSISQIAGISQKHKLLHIKLGTSVADVMRLMANGSSERAVLLNSQNEVVKVVTQSSIVQFLAKHKIGLDGAQETLEQMGFSLKGIIHVKESAMTLDAFKAISEHKITGIPILDSHGRILTNVSCRDLRDVVSDPFFFEMMRNPVEKFVSELKSRTFMPNADTMYPKICCRMNTKFADVVHKLAATKIHRIYVVDESDHPISVVSLHDVIKIYAECVHNAVSSNKHVGAGGHSLSHSIKPSGASAIPVNIPAIPAK